MNSSTAFVVPEKFSFVLGSACLAALVLNVSGLVLWLVRGSVFTDDVLENFRKTANSGSLDSVAVPAKGYPDEGSGRIAKSLAYKEWVRFNKAVRGHMNYNEQIVVFVLSILLCGLFKPVWAGWLGIGIAVGRLLYFVGYGFLGPAVMIAGELVALLPMFFNYGVFIYHLF